MKTKTLTFALMHFFIAFSVTYLITGSLLIGGAVAIIEPALNTVAFYFHEVWWSKKQSIKTSEEIQSALRSAGESYALRSM